MERTLDFTLREKENPWRALRSALTRSALCCNKATLAARSIRAWWRLGSREIRQEETVAVLQGELMALATTMCSSRGEEMQSDSRYTVKEMLPEFAGRLDVRSKRGQDGPRD